MKIFIQNMVSLRCKLKVKSELEKLGITFRSIELGEVLLAEPISKTTRQALQAELSKSALNLLDDKNAVLIEKIINVITEMVHYTEEIPSVKFSTFLSERLEQDYHKMAEVFSRTKGITIERFIILHKVERIKELISYDEFSLTEISYRMHYSSVAHLSKQFKQVTGLTPTSFKSLPTGKRTNLEDLCRHRSRVGSLIV